jgi:hypothetical protein
LGTKTGEDNGTCAPVTAGDDPDDECPLAGLPCTEGGAGCNGEAALPGCALLPCTCENLFPAGGPIYEMCGPAVEGCDVRINTTLLPCFEVCQSHGSTCVEAYQDEPNFSCNRATQIVGCAHNTSQSVVCVCSLGCEGEC